MHFVPRAWLPLTLSDEEKAQAFLETKEKTLDRVAALEERIASLGESQHRIDTFLAELATREAELKALGSGEQLAELEASEPWRTGGCWICLPAARCCYYVIDSGDI